METVRLVGTEEVMQAALVMRSAAETIQRWGSTGSATPDIDSRLRSIDETLLALLHEVQDTTRYCDITRCDGQAPMRINIRHGSIGRVTPKRACIKSPATVTTA